MQSLTESRENARFCYSPEPSPELQCAFSIRATIVEIAALIEAAESERLKLQLRPFFNPSDIEKTNDAMFVIRLLGRVLQAWSEYWDEEYIAEMAEVD